MRQYSVKYYQKHKGKCKKYKVMYNKKHPELGLKYMLKHLKKYGKTFEMNPMEFSFALQTWSKTIKKLDNYMCKLCDSTENLHAHHILPKALFPELSLSVDNGITLCEECHGKTHGYYIY